jgi:FtsZ-interacting cell division protein ZipA
MNWPAIIIIGIVVLAFIVFLAWRNSKDEKGFKRQLKSTYRKSTKNEDDALMAEVIK